MDFLELVFNEAINMTKIGSVLFLIILIARYMLSRFPKIYSYLLWIALFVRLLIPMNLSVSMGLIVLRNFKKNINTNTLQNISDGVVREYSSSNDVISTLDLHRSTMQYFLWFVIIIWIIGMIVISAYSIISYIKMRKKLSTATIVKDNIYETDMINSPFVFGFFKPRIYIPTELNEMEKLYLIRHEKIHIDRFDYILKQVCFLAVIVHWFNPLVWKAFLLMSEDMEMSCDERVMKDFRGTIKVDYSNSLLEFAAFSSDYLYSPIAFGEIYIEKRIKNILNYKKVRYKTYKVIYIAFIFWAVFTVSNPSAYQLYNNGEYGSLEQDFSMYENEEYDNHTREIISIKQSIADFKSTGNIKDIYIYDIQKIGNNLIVGFSSEYKIGVCVFKTTKEGMSPIYVQLKKGIIKHEPIDISGGVFIIDYGKNLEKKALVLVCNGSDSIDAKVYLNKKVVATAHTELNEVDMDIIDLTKFKDEDLEFKYFDSRGKEIDMNNFVKYDVLGLEI